MKNIVIKKIGSQLIKSVENFFSDKGFEYITLTTYGFQTVRFYKKCNYELEYVRENKENPKLSKYFLLNIFNKEREEKIWI